MIYHVQLCFVRFVVAGYAIDSDFRIGNLSKSWHCPTIGQGGALSVVTTTTTKSASQRLSAPASLQAYPHA
jgi:hypothetical protein